MGSDLRRTRYSPAFLLVLLTLNAEPARATFEPEAYVKAANTGASDYFGWAVALSGDTLAVGAYTEDSCATGVATTAATDNDCANAGAAYVYTRSVTTWTLEAYVKAPNAGASDFFGRALALSGDTLAVGARDEASCATGVATTAATDNDCSAAGAVYVFTRSGTTWTFEAYVKAPNAGAFDYFSAAVALSGDTLAVGATYEDSCATGVATTSATDNDCANTGAVYVFTRSGTTWTFEAYVKAPNAGLSDEFGYVVALSSDTLAIVARGEASCATGVATTAATDDGCTAAGAVYVFTRSGTTWTFEAYVKAPNTGASDYFGYSVALSGDTLSVGANAEDSCATGVATTAATDDGCTDAGAVYVFTRSGTTWTFEAYVKAPNAGASDNFGDAVALSSDTLAVGARLEDSCATGVATTAATDDGCSDAGAAYVFTRSGTTWTFEAYVKALNAGASDEFGYAVALSSDTVAVGAWSEGSCATGVATTAATDNSCSRAGASYLYAVPPSPPTPPLPPSSPLSPEASITGDPHVRGGHGDSFDFKGEDGGIYVLLSTPALSLSARFVHSTFLTPYSKLWVRGSWLREAYWTVRTRRGRLLRVSLRASSPMFNGSTAARTEIVEDVTFRFANRALAVSTPEWFTHAKVNKGNPHPGKLRLDVTIRPLRNLARASVAPHGLLGQTYDDDGAPLHGKRDSYSVLDDGTRAVARRSAGGVVTTRAKGEGAIEGVAEMYRVRHPFDTDFAFTRFGRTKGAVPRNVSLMRSSHAH